MIRKLSVLLIAMFCLSVLNAQEIRNARWAQPVNNGTLTNLYIVNNIVYRSEQPEADQFVEVSDLGIKCILNLRLHHSDEKLIAELKSEQYSVPMRSKVLGDQEIIAAAKVLKEAPKPILVHCKYGAQIGLVWF